MERRRRRKMRATRARRETPARSREIRATRKSTRMGSSSRGYTSTGRKSPRSSDMPSTVSLQLGSRLLAERRWPISVSAAELTSRSFSRQSGYSSARFSFRSAWSIWPLGWHLFWVSPLTRERRIPPTGRPSLRASSPRGNIYDFFIASFIFYNQDDVIMKNILSDMS